MAQKNGTSINTLIIYLLKKSLGFADDGGKKRDLSDLAGTWDKEREMEFRKAVQIFEEIDTGMWQ